MSSMHTTHSFTASVLSSRPGRDNAICGTSTPPPAPPTDRTTCLTLPRLFISTETEHFIGWGGPTPSSTPGTTSLELGRLMWCALPPHGHLRPPLPGHTSTRAGRTASASGSTVLLIIQGLSSSHLGWKLRLFRLALPVDLVLVGLALVLVEVFGFFGSLYQYPSMNHHHLHQASPASSWYSVSSCSPASSW